MFAEKKRERKKEREKEVVDESWNQTE